MGVGCSGVNGNTQKEKERKRKLTGGEEEEGKERREERKCAGEKSWMQMGIYSLRAHRQDGNEWASVTSISEHTHTRTHSPPLPVPC